MIAFKNYELNLTRRAYISFNLNA